MEANSGATILIVDDDLTTRFRVARSLKGHGYTTVEAMHGAEALQALAKHSVDLVLLDNVMPQISGLQVLRTIRKHFPPAQLPVLMFTATNDPESVSEALLLGANGFITKPVDNETILLRVSEQLHPKAA